MPTFSLLADPAGYVPCSTENMHVDHEYREHWLTHFEHHFESILKLALDNYGPSAAPRIAACRTDFVALLHQIRANPHILPRLDLLVLDVLRQEKLIAHGLPDPFEKTKARENQTSLAMYRRVVDELDSHTSDHEALLLAVEGVFAGNIFDLGAGATTKMFAENNAPDFFTVRNGLDGKRPWLVDHFDAMAQAILSAPGSAGGARAAQLSIPNKSSAHASPHAPPAEPGADAHTPRHKQAMFFCDNAGSDFVLGVVPLCRWLARRAGGGTRVLIAANRLPALNDMTVAEVKALLPHLQAIDPVLDSLVKIGRISAIDSGNGTPLIDLREVSDEVNHHAPQTDLLIIEGMGRAVESNFEAPFTVDTVKLAMIKEEIVARRHGGKNFDTICRFDAATDKRATNEHE